MSGVLPVVFLLCLSYAFAYTTSETSQVSQIEDKIFEELFEQTNQESEGGRFGDRTGKPKLKAACQTRSDCKNGEKCTMFGVCQKDARCGKCGPNTRCEPFLDGQVICGCLSGFFGDPEDKVQGCSVDIWKDVKVPDFDEIAKIEKMTDDALATKKLIDSLDLDSAIKFDEVLGPRCDFSYRTGRTKVTGYKYCNEGEHCCGCRNNKCCRSGQVEPDDPDFKIGGVCFEDVMNVVGFFALVALIAITVTRCLRNSSQTSPPAEPPSSRSLPKNGGKLLSVTVIGVAKKDDKEQLLQKNCDNA